MGGRSLAWGPMCDTLCVESATGTLFAKNSDRPVSEAQLIEMHPRRPASSAGLRTQYLDIPDAGAAAALVSRPEWLWGAEHGVNEHGVAVGNEKIYTVADPYEVPPALIGMDLVRLGLERGRDADEALEVMTSLLEEHGQGGVADASANEPYFSSFLMADPKRAWVLETAGRTWAARPVEAGAAISNRITIGADWTRASPDLRAGDDFDTRRNPDAPTGHADRRLAASRALLERCGVDGASPALLAAHLRDHGGGPWGRPGAAGAVVAPPGGVLPDGTGVTICMHVRGYQATTSAMVAELEADPEAPRRAWVAPGSPCVSVFVPVFLPDVVPPQLADPELWWRLAAGRDAVERDAGRLEEVRAVLDPLEAELWAEADAIADAPARWGRFAERAGERLVACVARLG
jgi:secernin